LQSRLSGSDEKLSLDLAYHHLIESYHAAIKNKTISTLLTTYPHSVILRLDRLQELMDQQAWHEALVFNEEQKIDPYWTGLPFVQDSIATIDSHLLSKKEFIRKYQKNLLAQDVSYTVLKYLASFYNDLNQSNYYFMTQAKYYVQTGDYLEALNQLKHPSVDQVSLYAKTIKTDAELMISVNQRLT
jgi:hypothetical protein